jgi:hypothetical protein
VKFKGTLIRPLADQRDRDNRFIDPAGVEFGNHRYPLTVEFDLSRTVGYATVSRAPDGSLVAEGVITEGDLDAVLGSRRPKLAVGIAGKGDDLRADVVRRCRVVSTALTLDHADPGQPPIEEVEEQPDRA